MLGLLRRYWQCQPAQIKPYWAPCEGKGKVRAIAASAGAQHCSHLFNTLRGGPSRPLNQLYCQCHCCPARPQLSMWDMCGGLSSPAQANSSDTSACCPVDSHCQHVNEW